MNLKSANALAIYSLGVIASTLLGYFVTEPRYGGAVATSLALTGGAILAVLLIALGKKFLRRRRASKLRGINRASLDDSFSLDLLNVWRGAQKEIVVFGMGLSRLSRNTELIRDAARRGVKVRLIALDPVWLEQSGPLLDALTDFYDTNNIVGKSTDAFLRLKRITDECNSEFGSQTVTLDIYRSTIMMSATIADPSEAGGCGVIEFHTYRSGDLRLRVHAINVPGSSNSSLLELVIKAIEAAVMRRNLPYALTSPNSRTPSPPVNALILSKAPVPGLSKTRLITDEDPSSARLLEQMVRSTAQNCIEAFGSVECAYLGDATAMGGALRGLDVALFESPSRDHVQALVQVVNERISLSGVTVLAVASDAPTVTAPTLQACVQALIDFDVAIVPSTDGGVCAIATRILLPEIDLSTSEHLGLMSSLMVTLTARGATLAILAARTDIDDLDSLARAVRTGMLADLGELEGIAKEWLQRSTQGGASLAEPAVSMAASAGQDDQPTSPRRHSRKA